MQKNPIFGTARHQPDYARPHRGQIPEHRGNNPTKIKDDRGEEQDILTKCVIPEFFVLMIITSHKKYPGSRNQDHLRM